MAIYFLDISDDFLRPSIRIEKTELISVILSGVIPDIILGSKGERFHDFPPETPTHSTLIHCHVHECDCKWGFD